MPDFTPEQIEWLSNLSALDLAKELNISLRELRLMGRLTLCEPPPPVIKMKVGERVRLRINDDGGVEVVKPE